MPLWRIFHPNNTFTTAKERDALAAAITDIYTSVGLPAFYVVVIFNAVPSASMYVGGVSNAVAGQRPFIRIVFENIARKLGGEGVDAALKPHVADKGYDWEYHGLETDRELWKIQGLVPPAPGSDVEKSWVEVNRPVPY